MTKRKLPPIAERRQAASILQALGKWCAARPGRRVTIALTEQGWRASLDTHATAGGESMTDALAQIAQTATFEVEP